MVEILFPPRGLLEALGKLPIVIALAFLATVMIVVESTFKNLNMQIQNFHHLSQVIKFHDITIYFNKNLYFSFLLYIN